MFRLQLCRLAKKNLTKFVNHWKMIKPLLIFVSFSIILNILFLKDIVFSYKFKWELIIRKLYKILPMSLTWALAFSWWIRCLCRSCALVITSMVLSILIVQNYIEWFEEESCNEMPCKFPLIYHPCIRSYSFSSLSKFWDFKWGHYPTEIKGSGTQVGLFDPLVKFSTVWWFNYHSCWVNYNNCYNWSWVSEVLSINTNYHPFDLFTHLQIIYFKKQYIL